MSRFMRRPKYVKAPLLAPSAMKGAFTYFETSTSAVRFGSGMARGPSPVGGFSGSSQHLMAYVVVSRLRRRSA
ncbi:hypothetical protein H074_17248, partial [Amycolatopsis decaplanina DSM 44594]